MNNELISDVVITAIESGPYGSFLIVAGNWRAAWEAADAGKINAYADIKVVDRYEVEEDGREPEDCEHAYLTDAFVRKGFKVLSEKYPHLAREILDENYDVIAADALLQCAFFGEIVYG